MTSAQAVAGDPLTDARTGIVTALERFAPGPDAPAGWVGWSARVGDTRRFADFSADRYGFGAALGDGDRARGAALGEACERYCGNAVPADLVAATRRELTSAGRRAVDPATVALFSDTQYAAPGFPFPAFTDDTRTLWTTGRDLLTGDAVDVPASMAYLNIDVTARIGERPLHPVRYAGIAAGVDVDHAETSAIEELLERDATSIWWASGAPAELLVGHDLPEIGRSCTQRVLLVPNEFDVPVVACFVEDVERGIIAFGSSCKADPRAAAEKAVVEAYAMFELTTEVADPGSALWAAHARGDFHAHTFVDFRPDRTYRDAFDPALRDMVDLPTLAQYYLDPRCQGEPLDRLRTHTRTRELDDVPAVLGDARTEYLRRLSTAGMDCLAVDLTTDDVRSAGRTVVRVVVPPLYGNAPAAYPYLGGDRLRTVPVRLGLVDRPLTEDDFYPHPIPHV